MKIFKFQLLIWLYKIFINVPIFKEEGRTNLLESDDKGVTIGKSEKGHPKSL